MVLGSDQGDWNSGSGIPADGRLLNMQSNPRLTLDARRETKYYADQSEMMAKFFRILGKSLTVIFSLGAIIGSMITMYSAVANRTSEIGTL
jgi:hypothetical protein